MTKQELMQKKEALVNLEIKRISCETGRPMVEVVEAAIMLLKAVESQKQRGES